MQVRTPFHTNKSILSKENFEKGVRCMTGEDGKRFFKLFQESTFEGSRATAREMKKIAKRQTTYNQKIMLFHSLHFLARSKSEMLSWPNSPLLVMLQFVDPNMLSGEGAPLHQLAFLADPFDYSTHKSQLILAKQLIEHGANVNAVSSRGQTPLHIACFGGVVMNLDFVEYLLEKGADPNAQDHRGLTPLMFTVRLAPGAAKFLLNWPTTDANITSRYGESFLARVRQAVKIFTVKVASPDNSEQVQNQFLLQQWIVIEEMLVKRGAVDTGVATLE
jgi:ankyrin repeat protein